MKVRLEATVNIRRLDLLGNAGYIDRIYRFLTVPLVQSWGGGRGSALRWKASLAMGFTFVDRISAIESDRARGELRRAPGAPSLPPWLVIEAVGQLAAWIAMLRSDFNRRPVAALIGEIQLGESASAGAVELDARIDRWDSRAVLYSGAARVGGGEVAVVVRAVGPLLPMEMFDDPAAMRQRLERLRTGLPTGEAGGAESSIPPAALSVLESGSDSTRAQLCVPDSAPFFADHFPRRPVYPASLLADAQHHIAAPLAARVLGVEPQAVFPARVADFKVRSFSTPGQVLELVAESRPPGDGVVGIAVSASAEGKRVASGVLEYRLKAARPT